MGNSKIVSAALVALTALAGGSARAELDKTKFGDWSIRCNDKDYCIAEVTGSAANGEAFRLKIERSQMPDSQVFVTLRPTTKLAVGLLARIEIEGERPNYGYFGEVSKIYKGNEMTFGGDADRPLIENLLLGQSARIEIEYGAPYETQTYSASLNGLTRALLEMDEVQGRIGRLDAIVARGGAAASEAANSASSTSAPEDAEDVAVVEPEAPADDLPPPVMPSQDKVNSGLGRGTQGMVYELAEIPDNILKMGSDTLGCQLEETVRGFGAQYYADGDVEKWLIPCQMADVNVPYYMGIHVPYDPSLDEWKEFETPPGFNQPNHALVNNMFFDPTTREVTGTTYSSANYDCGTFERHSEMAESGDYELVLYLEKTNCDGIGGPPEGWPLSWTIDEMGG